MKKIAKLLVFLIMCLYLTSCNGYNNIMRNHLSNEKSYISIKAEFYDYKDYEDRMYIYIKDNESMYAEDGSHLFDFYFYEEDIIQLELIGENYNTLKEEFINKEISSGMYFEIKCSNWIYMDTNFYYIAELKILDKIYLSFEEGLDNIIKYMNNNKSIF